MNPTVVIGLDAATFSILDPLTESGTMPFLREFVAHGTRAELLSTRNPLTAMAWPSLMTGRSPGNHGILDFVRFEEGAQGGYFTTTNYRDLCCETIWSMASRHNRTITALNFYGMWPARPVAGYTMSGFVSWRHMKDACYPSDLYDKVKALPGFDRKELAKDVDLERKCIQGLPLEEYEDWVALYTRKEQQWFNILRHLMTTDPTDLTAIVFEAVDKIQHLCWRFLSPELFPERPSAWEQQVRNVCLKYFQQIDHFITEIVALAGPEAQVYIVSDHGFGTSTEIFYVNEWLHEYGYLQWADSATPDDEEILTSERVSSNATALDWSRTNAYAITSSSNGIFIRKAKDSTQAGVRTENYEAFRQRLIDSLLAYRDPKTNQSVVTRVQTREEAYPGSQMHRAPDLLLTLRDGGFVSVVKADSPLKSRSEPVGTHRPEGIFIASGPGIRKGVTVPQLSILNVAPTLLYSLGLPIPQDMEGRLATSIFEPAYLQDHPARFGEATLPFEHLPEYLSKPASNGRQDAEGAEGAVDPEDALRDAEIIQRLKALGYLE